MSIATSQSSQSLSGEQVVAVIEGILKTLTAGGKWTRGALARDLHGAALESSQAIREHGVSFSLLGAIEARIERADHQRAIINAITEASDRRNWGSFLGSVNDIHGMAAVLDLLKIAVRSARLKEWRLLQYPELPEGSPTLVEHEWISDLLSKLEDKESFHWGVYTCWGNITPTLRAEADAYIQTLRAYLDRHPTPTAA